MREMYSRKDRVVYERNLVTFLKIENLKKYLKIYIFM